MTKIEITHIVAKNLVKRRKAAGLDAKEIAELLNIPVSYVHSWERGGLLEAGHLGLLAIHYRCPVGAFYMGVFTRANYVD